MNLHRNIHVHNKAIILILLPTTIFLWLIGWSLSWTGSVNKPLRPKPIAETDTSITTTMALKDHKECKT